MDHLLQQRKVLQTSNFARQFNFPVPGRTAIFVNGGIDDERSSLEEQNDEHEGDSGWDDMDNDEDNLDGGGDDHEHSLNPRDVTVEDVLEDEEINYGQDQERVLAESYEDERTMHEILGLSGNETIFLPDSRCDIEQSVRAIVYPNVEIMVSFVKQFCHNLM
jgi:hypothetical protein